MSVLIHYHFFLQIITCFALDVHRLAVQMAGTLADRYSRHEAIRSSHAYVKIQIYWTYLDNAINFDILRFNSSIQLLTNYNYNFTARAFSVSAPSTWNSLPTHVRSLDKLSTFKRQLVSSLPVRFCRLVTQCQRLRFVLRFWRYIN